MAKLVFNCDWGEGRGREETPKLAMPKKYYLFIKASTFTTKKSNAPMALVSAAALFTEQLAFVEILKLQIPS